MAAQTSPSELRSKKWVKSTLACVSGGGSEYSESLASRRMAVRLVADKEDAEDWNLCIARAEILPIPSADWTKVRKTRGLVTPVRR